ncbi:hypothetical protein AMECASPLE_016475 [Ameca splendens]|uniref:Uncharacterized protein n=1 Tax=Ameca splendens TaxID=208324 RepID=A0ABV1A9M9_9TELE
MDNNTALKHPPEMYQGECVAGLLLLEKDDKVHLKLCLTYSRGAALTNRNCLSAVSGKTEDAQRLLT